MVAIGKKENRPTTASMRGIDAEILTMIHLRNSEGGEDEKRTTMARHPIKGGPREAPRV